MDSGINSCLLLPRHHSNFTSNSYKEKDSHPSIYSKHMKKIAIHRPPATLLSTHTLIFTVQPFLKLFIHQSHSNFFLPKLPSTYSTSFHLPSASEFNNIDWLDLFI